MRRAASGVGLAALAASAALVPSVARACELTDPGCYIDDFAHQQLRELALSIWQINRAGLVLARWVEDLRAWLTDIILVDAFTQLARPVHWTFLLALIIAWMIFVISFMAQALVDLRWVDLRRAAGPIVLALLVFAKGGELMQQSERIRLLGSSMLQGIAQSVIPDDPPENSPKHVPAISMVRSGDLPDQLKPLYKEDSSCGTKARAVPGLALNDYGAYYLLADAGDIHCAETLQLATNFRTAFFGAASIAEIDGWQRKAALSLAAQGGLRQITGLFMTAGALIEQLMQLLFALALSMVWFGLLLSLVFAVFLPSEALFAQQLRALLTVMRASWLASFLLGLGLAILKAVAASGNGFVLLICGLVLIAVCVWQCRQALGVLHASASSASAAMAGAPQAVGGMLRSWATTGALVAGVAATGGIGTAATQIGATMARRMGRQAGDNPLARAAGRVLSRRVADRLDALTADQQLAHEADLGQAEAAWYERLPPERADAPARAETARTQSRSQQARLLDRRAARARQQRNFALADQLRSWSAALRPARQIAPAPLEDEPATPAAHAEQLAHTRIADPSARRVRQAQIAHMRAAARPNPIGEKPRTPAEPTRKRSLRVAQKASTMSAYGSTEFLMDLAPENEIIGDARVSPVRRISIGLPSQKPAPRRSVGAPSAERSRPMVGLTTVPDMINHPDDRRATAPAVPTNAAAPSSDAPGLVSTPPAQPTRASEDSGTSLPVIPADPQSDTAGQVQGQAGYTAQQRSDRANTTGLLPAIHNTSIESGSARPAPTPVPAPAKAVVAASLPQAAQPAQPISPAGGAAAPKPATALAASAYASAAGRSPEAQTSLAPEPIPAPGPGAVAAAPTVRIQNAPARPDATRGRMAEPQEAAAPRASAPQQPWKRKRGQA